MFEQMLVIEEMKGIANKATDYKIFKQQLKEQSEDVNDEDVVSLSQEEQRQEAEKEEVEKQLNNSRRSILKT